MDRLSPKVVLVTGASRGIGLELIRQFLKLPYPPELLFGTSRDPDNAKELLALADTNPTVFVVKLDVTDQQSIDAAYPVIEEKVGDLGLNLLINNAGMLKMQGLADVTTDVMIEHFRVNCLGALMVSKTFLPLLKKAARLQPDKPLSCSRAAVINIGARTASISENTTAGLYPSRVSKCGLNMVTSNLSIELKDEGILVTVVHPGWLKTEMGLSALSDPVKEKEKSALREVDQGVEKIMNLLSRLEGEEGTGKFYHLDGFIIGW